MKLSSWCFSLWVVSWVFSSGYYWYFWLQNNMHLRFHTLWIPVASLQGTGTLRTFLTHSVYCFSKQSTKFNITWPQTHFTTIPLGLVYCVVLWSTSEYNRLLKKRKCRIGTWFYACSLNVDLRCQCCMHSKMQRDERKLEGVSLSWLNDSAYVTREKSVILLQGPVMSFWINIMR